MLNKIPVVMHEAIPPDPDWDLMQAIARGDVQALNDLYAQYGGLLMGYLIMRTGDRTLAEEIMQDTMLAVWEHAGQFERRSKVKTWLLTIARNRAINAHRRKQVNVIQLSDVFAMQSDDTGPIEFVERDIRAQAVRHAIQTLPEAQREVLTLVFYHQLAMHEIANVLDISVGTVKSRLHRAKDLLRRVLLQEDDL